MGTINEYFDTENTGVFSTVAEYEIRSASSNDVAGKLRIRLNQDFRGNSKYWSIFIPNGMVPQAAIEYIFSSPDLNECKWPGEAGEYIIETGLHKYSERASSKTLVFTRRMILYIDYLVPISEREKIKKIGERHNYSVLIRDREYAIKTSENQKPLAFISHDSRDKKDLVRDLVTELSSRHCRVWYDEYSLEVGDSLREKIETGLKETNKCVLILSPNFINNKGWSKAEFDSIYTKEILEHKNVILPVWHNVTSEQVYDYSPRLLDRFALSSEIGVRQLARKLEVQIRKTT